MSDQTPPERIAELEERTDQLEATIRKMLPGRRDALKLGGAAALGAAAFSGTASAGSSQVGTIGDSSNLVDVEAEDINVDDTLTTQDLVVNGTATGPFGGGGGVILESGDTITVAAIREQTTDEGFETLYDGSAKDVLGGIVRGPKNTDWLYTFSDSSTLRKNGPGTSFTRGNTSESLDDGGDRAEVGFLPPAKDVTKVEVGSDLFSGATFAGEIIFKD